MKHRTKKIPPTNRAFKKPELKIEIDNCLLVGNGLNRCLPNDSISWGNLLQKIADELNVDYYKDNPMPLEFERIINTYLANQPSNSTLYNFYTNIKYKIADMMRGSVLPDEAVHRNIPKMKNNRPRAILTTNYDYLLEYAFDNKFQFEKNIEKHMYIPQSTYQVDGVEFYHIHGFIGDPKSICLGYNQYMSIVSCLRNAISRKGDNLGQSLYIRQILSGARQPTGAWPERFFYSNMAIMGFGLDQCEADIWWLLSYRAYLYYTNSWNMRDLIRNNIVYYRIIDRRSNKGTETSYGIKPSVSSNTRTSSTKRDNSIWYIDDQDLTEEEKRFNRLLRSEHIGVNMYVLRDGVTYEDAYRQILLDIDKKGIREYRCNNVELSYV